MRFTGIAKKMSKHYFSSGLLTKEDLLVIQLRVDAMKVPASVGRLPRKIASGYSAFTADQWKNWTLIYSSIALRDVLPAKDYQIWMLFVRAVFYFTRTIISNADLERADAFLLRFCMEVEKHYGKAFCTPNMHMSLHLSQCVKDFGPLYAFWCYSFER